MNIIKRVTSINRVGKYSTAVSANELVLLVNAFTAGELQAESITVCENPSDDDSPEFAFIFSWTVV